MALRDQPYLPLFIQDIMTDEKLNECCAATHGIFIKGIMCLMHKSETYGKILLKQKYKQTESISLNFGLQICKHTPYQPEEISAAIIELLEFDVCQLDGDYLCQKRMIRDNRVSEARSIAGKKGGGNPNFVKKLVKTNLQTSTEYENEYKSEIEDVVDIKKEGTGRKKFTPPLQEEVILYCEERNNNVDPVKWYNFYQAKDWMIGKNKIKDWKAAVRTWENNNSDGKNKPNNAKSKEFDLSRFEGYSDEKTN